MIPNGTLVRLRTTNGGDATVLVAGNIDGHDGYRPTYGCWFSWPVSGHSFYVEAERIASVEPQES